MFHIIWLLLKIIGWILLFFLGAFLLVLILVAIVPIRYQFQGNKDKNLSLKMRATWFFRAVSVHFRYIEEEQKKPILLIRLFGIRIFDSTRPKKERSQKKKKRKNKRKSLKTDAIPEKKADQKKIEEKEVEEKQEKNITIEEGIEHSEITQQKEEENISEKEAQKDEEKESRIALQEEKKEEQKKHGILRKIRLFWEKLKKIPDSIRAVRDKIKQMGKAFRDGVIRTEQIIKKWNDFRKEEINRAAFGTTLGTIKKVLKYIKPKKLKMSVTFGTGDPCSTGQILGIAAVFYPLYGRTVQIIPDFEEKILEGNIDAKGYVRVFTVLRIGVQFIRDKTIRQAYRNIRKFKEEL